jgi:hypothetical protein
MSQMAEMLAFIAARHARPGSVESLRECAIVALDNAGLSSREIARLSARAVSQHHQTGHLIVQVKRAGQRVDLVVLNAAQTPVLFEYIEAARCWQEERPLFVTKRGRTWHYNAVSRIVRRWRRHQSGAAGAAGEDAAA